MQSCSTVEFEVQSCRALECRAGVFGLAFPGEAKLEGWLRLL